MKKMLLIFLCTLMCVHKASAQFPFFSYGSSWKYLDNGSAQGSLWRNTDFDDTTWKTGTGRFGYGLSGISTTVSYGPNKDNKYITTYFRKAVSIADIAAFGSFTARAYREDGIVVYVNGTEVYRNNLSGTVSATTLASSAGSDGADPVSFNINASFFTSGTNIIAAEVHQSSVSSSDMMFDMSLTGNLQTTNPFPYVSGIVRQSPAFSATNAPSVVFRVAFSESVSGVDLSDFVVTPLNGTVSADATAITPVGAGGSEYDITVGITGGTGDLRLDVKALGTDIKDASGNGLVAAFTSGQVFTIQLLPPTTYGFATAVKLNGVSSPKNTGEKPQAKVWMYDNKWWCVLPTSSSTKLFRLDGSSWTSVLTLYSSNDVRADCKVVGNVTHILLFRGPSTSSYLVSVEYDNSLKNYKLWSKRTSRSSVSFGSGTETATLEVDGTGRMWVASAGTSDVTVRWSDAPYTSWSSTIKIASGLVDDDICAITTLPGKIGVLWSNQDSERFGFKTHTDGASPSTWSADEAPGATSAKDVGNGFADDHMNIVRASDGTLYCAVKTSYDSNDYPTIGLLVRRPAGTWDKLYTVTKTDGSTHNGTRPIVLLNESLDKVKVVYTSVENGGDILYRESSLSAISFGSARTLLDGNYNNATSTHQVYSSEVVLLATNQSNDQAVGILGNDLFTGSSMNALEALSGPAPERTAYEGEVSVSSNPLSGKGVLTFTLPETGEYTLSLYSITGTRISVLRQGWAEAGRRHTVPVDVSGLTAGIYLVKLQAPSGSKALKLAVE